MLKKSTGNMYSFLTHTWNPVRGKCGFGCSYCYVEKIAARFGRQQSPLHLDEKELRTNLGDGNHIFVCSGCDLFHWDVPDEWIIRIFARAHAFSDNKYLWHTKNPLRARHFMGNFGDADILCSTIETNRLYLDIMNFAPLPGHRFLGLECFIGKNMITIEPIMDFDLEDFSGAILNMKPIQVNIGADSGRNGLPEPPREKIEKLLELLAPHTKIHLKSNLRRILPESRYYG